MDRKQQLEAMGWECLMAWQGKIQALQDQSTFPVANLASALPQLRAWIGDLGKAHQGWLSVTADNAALLDPMLPWHWLDMAWGGLDIVEGSGHASPLMRAPRQNFPKQQQQPAAPSVDLPEKQSLKSQPVHSNSKVEERPAAKAVESEGKEDASDGTRSQHSQPLRKEADKRRPSENRNSSPNEADQNRPQGEKPSEKGPATKEKENWLLNEGSNDIGKNDAQDAPEKQVIFRGLQDFASFIQSPMPPAQFRDESKEKKQGLSESPSVESHGKSQGGFEELEGKSFLPQGQLDTPHHQGISPSPFVQENAPKLRNVSPKIAHPKAEAHALHPDLQGIALSEALLPDLFSPSLGSPEPEALSREQEGYGFEEDQENVAEHRPSQEKASFPAQYPESSPIKQQALASPTLSSLGTALTQLVQSPSHVDAPSTRQSSGKGKMHSHYPTPRLALRPSSPPEPLQAPQLAEQSINADAQQPAPIEAQAAESSSIPVPPAWSSSVPVLQEPGPELMESILEAMAEQLQRDFERYYGS